jgi:hypothetical protein
VIGVDSVPVVGRVDQAAALYGMTILCFLSGIHWATHLYDRSPVSMNLFIFSNVVFLGVLLPYMLGSILMSILAELIAFPLLLAVDLGLRNDGAISNHYFRVRAVATTVAWLSLAAIFTMGASIG